MSPHIKAALAIACFCVAFFIAIFHTLNKAFDMHVIVGCAVFGFLGYLLYDKDGAFQLIDRGKSLAPWSKGGA